MGAHGRRGEKAQGVKLGPIEKQKPHLGEKGLGELGVIL